MWYHWSWSPRLIFYPVAFDHSKWRTFIFLSIADVTMETEIWFTVEQKGHKSIAGLKYEVRWCNHGNQGTWSLKYKGSVDLRVPLPRWCMCWYEEAVERWQEELEGKPVPDPPCPRQSQIHWLGSETGASEVRDCQIIARVVAQQITWNIIIIISCHRFSFFPGTSPLEPVVNPTTQASSLRL
jgi:hypothetical protein